MKNKKFISHFAPLTIGMMIACAIYIFTLPWPREVVNYELSNEMTYAGRMKDGKFEGTGSLKTSDGTYNGSFADGRFEGRGIFSADGYSYLADFDKETNSDVIIRYKDGTTFKKINGKWVKIGQANEN